jgi:hypothetical protein
VSLIDVRSPRASARARARLKMSSHRTLASLLGTIPREGTTARGTATRDGCPCVEGRTHVRSIDRRLIDPLPFSLLETRNSKSRDESAAPLASIPLSCFARDRTPHRDTTTSGYSRGMDTDNETARLARMIKSGKIFHKTFRFLIPSERGNEYAQTRNESDSGTSDECTVVDLLRASFISVLIRSTSNPLNQQSVGAHCR